MAGILTGSLFNSSTLRVQTAETKRIARFRSYKLILDTLVTAVPLSVSASKQICCIPYNEASVDATMLEDLATLSGLPVKFGSWSTIAKCSVTGLIFSWADDTTITTERFMKPLDESESAVTIKRLRDSYNDLNNLSL
jgi:hypothetical protein